MIVKCTDGKFYRDPRWEYGRSAVITGFDGVQLLHAGHVKWGTAVSMLRKAGIRAVQVDKTQEPEQSHSVLGGSFTPCSIFNIRFTGPPSVPDAYNLVFNDEPPLDTSEPILNFKKVRKCKPKPTPDS